MQPCTMLGDVGREGVAWWPALAAVWSRDGMALWRGAVRSQTALATRAQPARWGHGAGVVAEGGGQVGAFVQARASGHFFLTLPHRDSRG